MALAAVLALSQPVWAAGQDESTSQDTRFTRAFMVHGILWLLSDSGGVSSVPLDGDARTPVALPGPALDLCVSHGAPVAIIGKRTDDWTWRVVSWTGQGWAPKAELRTYGDRLLGLACDEDHLSVLTSRRIFELGKGQSQVVRLSGDFRTDGIAGFGARSTIYGVGGQIFVGFNAGEWGGGMSRIDRKSGEVHDLGRTADGQFIGEPITDFATEPWKPDCVAVAAGLVHFEPSGAIFEVCGDHVRLLYARAFSGDQSAATNLNASGDAKESYPSVAFFGVESSGDRLWAAGIDGLYRFGAGGAEKVIPWPKFKVIAGVCVSFDVAGFVLVLTNANQRFSISGSTPLLVPRMDGAYRGQVSGEAASTSPAR